MDAPDPITSSALYEQAGRLAAEGPVPAVVGNVAFGTAGWTDKSLLTPGLFYPQGCRTPRERLQHYVSQFSIVEVDATYYALLPPSTAQSWVEGTPKPFRFHIKAHPVFTGHPIDTAKLPKDLQGAVLDLPTDARGRPVLSDEIRAEIRRRFFDFLAPLVQAGRLGRLMLQFPPWFDATRGNARRIEQLASELDVPLSVEFRHKSWLLESRRERVFSLLAEHRISYVAVDEPDTLIGGVPGIARVTCDELAMIRLHGQNAPAWKRGSAVAERFNYLYSAQELGGWVPRVRELSTRARAVHVVFNNCVRDFAVLNAKGLAALLGRP